MSSYAEPERMGVDRWLVMLAAHARNEGALCVIDAGTAVTVDWSPQKACMKAAISCLVPT